VVMFEDRIGSGGSISHARGAAAFSSSGCWQTSFLAVLFELRVLVSRVKTLGQTFDGYI
jgi:hypothetical protein